MAYGEEPGHLKWLVETVQQAVDKPCAMANIIAAEALFGKDEYCMNYLQAYRGGMIEN